MPKAAADKVTAKPKPKPRKANGYKFPKKLPLGEILKDTAKKEWKLGPSIGQGGFGEIYSASAVGEKSSSDTYVIKIEPHENGPLFVERNFYLKLAKIEDVNAWKSEKGVKVLGVPGFYGSGSHEYNKEKYRFIVIERYGKDLWTLFQANKKKFPAQAVFKCAIQIIDILHYIHDKGYVHGDIKGANLLLGLRKGTENQVYLVDFGLACKFNTKEFKKDPRKAHNGTIEYTSRDWHIGVPTKRGDMEILGFNLLHWLGSTLPWEKDITNAEKVYQKKSDFMEHIKDSMKKDYPQVSKVITLYLDYVRNLKHDETPDYKFCKEMFSKELKGNLNGKLDFTAKSDEMLVGKKTPQKSPKKAKTPLSQRLGVRKRSLVSTRPRSAGSDSDEIISDEDDVVIEKKTPQKSSRKAKTSLAQRSAVRKGSSVSTRPRSAGSDSDEIISDEDDVVIEKKTPQKSSRKAKTSLVQRRTAKKRSFVSISPSSTRSDNDGETVSDEDDIIEDTPTPKKIRNQMANVVNPKKEDVVGKGKGRGKKEVAVKVSWRDAPTIQSSKVTVAGEYVKAEKPKPARRPTRK